jgi:3-hydroxyisobutyryl-CoA hydrolase
MIRKIVPRLVEWEKSDLANVVVLKGAGPKALCAGGDVATLAELNQGGEEGWKKSAAYFALEYKLDHYIATYKKPYIAFMDGITMGGGVGLSAHAPFRIATEKTIFAMPETGIGFFPDVGASFFLPRMNGSIGTYLALTSAQLRGPNVFYAGIATHYLDSTSLPDLEARLAELRFQDSDTLPERLALINQTLEEFCTGLPHDQPIQLAGQIRQAIDRCFNRHTISEIIAALEAENDPSTKEWAQQQLKALHQKSPTALHVALRQMRIGGEWDIAETFKREHQIATKFMQHPDFTEGVSALLIRKDEAMWDPRSLADIGGTNVAKPFFEYDSTKELELFTDRTYKEHPYQEFGVPTEKEIEKVLSKGTCTREELANKIVASRSGRQGISEIVAEIIDRKTVVNDKGKAVWVKDEVAPGSKL